MSAFILSQILIGIAFLFDLASFQFKKREITLFFFFCAASLISAHFFLLGATTAGFVVAVSAVRFLISIFYTKSWMKYFFLVAIFTLGVWTYDGYEDVFAIVAMLFGTIAAFSVNEKLLRQFMMVASIFIITHNIIILTPGGIFVETFFLGSNLLSYWRFYLRDRIS